MRTCQDIINKRKEIWEKHHDINLDRRFVHDVSKALIEDSAQGALLRSEIAKDKSLLIEMSFYIVDKKKKTVPFFLNDVQHKLNGIIKEHRALYEEGKINFLKFLILKGRQQGMTAFITAYQLSCAITDRNFAGWTMAHEDGATRRIFEEKAKFPYRNLPDTLKPTEKYNNRREFLFDKLNSSWGISTAGNEESGRGGTPNFFHGSEAAFWGSIDKIMSGLGESLPAGSIEILESTANGHNEFKKLWDDAKAGNNNYVPLFFEWWETPEYRLRFETEEIREWFIETVENGLPLDGVEDDEFTEKLIMLRVEKGLDWEQLYWYYNKKKDKKEKCEQEYPCTDTEAFLHSGRPYFAIRLIERLKLKWQNFKARIRKYSGRLELFEEPVEGVEYVIGADVAEGLEEGDYDHAAIYRADTWVQVGYIHGHFDTDVFGDLLVDTAEYFNGAYIGIERNNHGHAVLNTVYKYRGYKNIFMEVSIDDKNDKKSRKLGWHTNSASKYVMLDELDSAIRNQEITPRDYRLFEEMHEVVLDEKGNVNTNGKDRVVAHAITWQMRKYYHRKTKIKHTKAGVSGAADLGL